MKQIEEKEQCLPGHFGGGKNEQECLSVFLSTGKVGAELGL